MGIRSINGKYLQLLVTFRLQPAHRFCLASIVKCTRKNIEFSAKNKRFEN